MEYNEIESFSNSLLKHELKLPLSDPLFQIQHKDSIKKLLKSYFSVGRFEMNTEFYYLYFSSNGNIPMFNQMPHNSISKLKIHFKKSFQLAEFKILEFFIENSIFPKYLDELVHLENQTEKLEKMDNGILFSHCTGETNYQKRLNFIKSLLNEEFERNELGNLFAMLVGYDDIELVKYMASTCEKGFTFGRVIPFIKSIEMLDYIFENHKLLLKNGACEIWKLKNLQLFKHYEFLHRKSSNKPILISIPQRQSYLDNCLIEIFEYIISSGPSFFDLKKSAIQYIDDLIRYYYPTDNGKFEMFKLLFINYQLPFFKMSGNKGISEFRPFDFNLKKSPSSSSSSSFAIPKYLNWLFINYNGYLKGGYMGYFRSKIGFHKDDIAVEVYYLTGRYNQLLDIGYTYLYQLIKDHFDQLDSNLLDFICINLKEVQEAPIFKELLTNIFKIILNGKFHLLEHIQQNHNWALKPKPIKLTDDDGTSIYTMKECKLFLLKSLESNNIEISEWLYEFITLTPKSILQI